MVKSETPSRASPPIALVDTEVVSRRASLGHEEVQEAVRTLPEGNTSAAKDMGGPTPWRLRTGAMTNPAPSQTLFRRPIRLHNQVSRLLRKKEVHLVRR